MTRPVFRHEIDETCCGSVTQIRQDKLSQSRVAFNSLRDRGLVREVSAPRPRGGGAPFPIQSKTMSNKALGWFEPGATVGELFTGAWALAGTAALVMCVALALVEMGVGQ